MKLVTVFFTGLLVSGVSSHMPTVYEFCSHVVASGDGARATCDASQCHGRPGKIGPSGPRGIPGFKGDKGETGTSEGIEEKVKILEESIERLTNRLSRQQPTKEIVCYMGMKNHAILDSALAASSHYPGVNFLAKYGRLDFQHSYPPASAWCAGSNRVGEWFQVDFGKSEWVAGVITQGRGNNPQWVTSFMVQCGNSTENLETIEDRGIEKVFNANTDQNTKVVNKFPKPVRCRYIRIYPQSWYGHISMRMELIGGECYDMF